MKNIHHKYVKAGFTTLGPLGNDGFPMTDEMARLLESQIKQMEPEGLAYTRAFVGKAAPELVPGERADISIISDESIDRDNEVVLAKGLDVKPFLKNPVVPVGHNYVEPPVGRATWVKRVGDGWKAKTIYANRPTEYPAGVAFPADLIWALVSQEILNGKSIGFMPLAASAPTTKEIEARPELASVKTVIRKASMFEYSVVTVPANANAIVEAVAKIAKGQTLPEKYREMFGLVVEEMEPELKSLSPWVWESADYLDAETVVPKMMRTTNQIVDEVLKRLR